MTQDIFPVDDSGLTPHTNPLVQTIEQIDVSGVPHWKVTNYAFGELNDGSSEWQKVFSDFFKSNINLIETRLPDADLTEEEKAELQAYAQTVSNYTEFPIGFVMPALPTCFNKLLEFKPKARP